MLWSVVFDPVLQVFESEDEDVKLPDDPKLESIDLRLG